ncbi:nitronate monooxygenase [Candidatus Marinamargulisbacteria bacterium SCGC AG-410-N11]|nr:nitronate monooxygenase [Candidatus Marinamargulisbacteria bacterium SCGC AG-410-N11]
MVTIDLLKNNLRVPVIGAPMFIISTPELVIAQCLSGVVGCFPSLNARPQSQLQDWIQQIKRALAQAKQENPSRKIAPFGVNLVAMTSNKRLQQDLAVCIKEQVPIIITSMQPPKEVAHAVHQYGGLHFHDVISIRHAEKAIEAGVDGLVLVCAGAGGHGGTLHPFPFVKEVRKRFDGLIMLAGCISSGKEIKAAKMIGADLCYIGSSFIATSEANASAQYKKMVVDSTCSDIVYTPYFSGVNANFLIKSIENAGYRKESLSPPRITKPNKLVLWFKHMLMNNKKSWKDIWSAGQGVTGIDKIQSVESFISQLENEFQNG